TNGEGINIGETWDNYCDIGFGYPQVLQSSLFLNWPENPDRYILFHRKLTFESSPDGGIDVITAPLYYSLISYEENTDGEVVEKNVILYDDLPLMEGGEMTANKHANGIDWWITHRLSEGNGFMNFLLTGEGIEGPYFQSIDWYNTDYILTGGREVEFSSDGTKFVRYRAYVGMDVYDFDRQTGQFTLIDTVLHPDLSESVVLNGMGLSPSGRFVYVSTYTHVYQYDLEANNIAESEVLIHEFTNPDSLFIGPHSVHFQLGPDCRLYNFMNSGRFIHRINYPDLPGEACGFELNAIELPFSSFRDQPQFPHFRLGPIGDEGSPCVYEPTSTAVVEATQASLRVYPNPSAGPIRLFLPAGESPGLWRLFDLQGRPLQEVPLRGGETVRVDVQAGLAAGTYIWQLWREGRVVESGRAVRP
ncbi:MAG: hypothetical protein AAGF87_14490, partial [Bacteroidota bacterium]